MQITTTTPPPRRAPDRAVMELNASDQPYHCVWNDESDSVLIVFRGMPLTPTEWIPFQMVRTTIDLPCSKIYVRDFARAWYHQGLQGHSVAIDDTAALLLDLILARPHIKRIATTGVSAGGYAAFLFGYLMQVDEAHGFSPQTYIDVDNRIKNNDFLMEDYLPNVYSHPHLQAEYLDLKPLFESQANTSTRCFIHYDRQHPSDKANADHFGGVPNAYQRVYQEGGHQVARHLKNLGKIDDVFEHMLAGTSEQRDIHYDY
ncbi:MAG: hypothetical protein AAF511_09990 [Pseudomonadota bacterium]